MNNIHPWGFYPESFLQKMIRIPFILGLGRGKHLRSIAHCLWSSSGQKSRVDIIYHGVRIRLNPSDGMDRKILFRSGMRDKKEIAFIKSHADSARTFLDIGSHYGYYSLMALISGYKNVVAIDPDPNAFGMLKFHLETNDFMDKSRLFMEGASDEPGQLYLNIANAALAATPSAQTIAVPVRTLSQILDDAHCKTVGVFKIDVEGHEDKVLIPWLESMDSRELPRAAVVEFCNSEIWRIDVIDYMKSRGYAEQIRTRSNICMSLS